MTLNPASDEVHMNIPQDVAYNLIEEMEKNNHSRGNVRQVASKPSPKTDGLYKVSAFDHMIAKVGDLYQNNW